MVEVTFLWVLGVLIVNAYVAYKTFMRNKGIQYISQHEFLRKICLVYIAPQKSGKIGRELEVDVADPGDW